MFWLVIGRCCDERDESALSSARCATIVFKGADLYSATFPCSNSHRHSPRGLTCSLPCACRCISRHGCRWRWLSWPSHRPGQVLGFSPSVPHPLPAGAGRHLLCMSLKVDGAHVGPIQDFPMAAFRWGLFSEFVWPGRGGGLVWQRSRCINSIKRPRAERDQETYQERERRYQMCLSGGSSILY